MTISTIQRTIEYTLDGTTTAFAIPFPWLIDAWIDATDDGVTLTQGSQYTLAGTGESSGTLTLTSAGTAGHTLAITRTVPMTQLLQITNRGAFLAEQIEAALDTLTMIAQQLVGGTLVPSGLDASLYQLPVPDATKLIGWNSTATGLVNVERSAVVIDGGGDSGAPFDINALTELVETPSNPDFIPLFDVSAGAQRKVAYSLAFGALMGDARFAISGAQALTASTEATVLFAIAGHNYLQRCTFNLSTGILTATESVRVLVTAHTAIVSQPAGGAGELAIQRGTTDVERFTDKVEADSTSRDLHLAVSAIVTLLTGETVRIRALSGNSRSLSATASLTSLHIVELG